MDKHILKAKKRTLDVKPRALRQEDLLPANVYGVKGSQPLTLEAKAVDKMFSVISESTVVYIDLEGKEIPTLISEVQYDPVSGGIIHIAFRQVNLKQKVTASIPVETTGEFNVPGAMYHVVTDEIEAEGLPTDLPEAFILDLGKLSAIGDSVTFADLDYDREKLTLKIDDEKLPVIVVNAVEEEEQEEEKPAEETAAATDTDTNSENDKKEEPEK